MDATHPQTFTSPGLLDRLQSVAVIVGGLGTLVVALTWALGRIYFESYFAAMGLPIAQLSFDSSDYIAFGSVYLAIAGFVATATPAIVAVMGLFYYLLTPILTAKLLQTRTMQRVKAWLVQQREGWTTQLQGYHFNERAIDRMFQQHSAWGSAYIILCVGALLFVWVSGYAAEQGTKNGHRAITRGIRQVRLVSATDLALPQRDQATDGVFVYENLYLLTSNNGQYFLFDKLVPDTCRAEQLYIVRAEQIQSMQVGPPVSIVASCERSGVEENEPTPAPTVTEEPAPTPTVAQ